MTKSKNILGINFPILLVAVMITSSSLQPLASKTVTKQKETTSTLLAQTPPLGYNSFDSYGVGLYEEVAMKEIDAFIEKFVPHGYEYFVIDNGWFSAPKTTIYKGYQVTAPERPNPVVFSVDAYGVPTPSKSYFPNGFKPIADKLHAKGLKFGIHLMRGIPRISVDQNLPISDGGLVAAELNITRLGMTPTGLTPTSIECTQKKKME
jgi:hypothetical protein